VAPAAPVELVAGAVLVAEVAFWSVAAVPAAVAAPEPTVLGEVWLLTGGLVVAVLLLALLGASCGLLLVVAVLELGGSCEVVEVWFVLALELAELRLGGVFMVFDEPLLAGDALVVWAEVPLAEEELLAHGAEIMLMDVTLREPPPLLSLPERDPWTST